MADSNEAYCVERGSMSDTTLSFLRARLKKCEHEIENFKAELAACADEHAQVLDGLKEQAEAGKKELEATKLALEQKKSILRENINVKHEDRNTEEMQLQRMRNELQLLKSENAELQRSVKVAEEQLAIGQRWLRERADTVIDNMLVQKADGEEDDSYDGMRFLEAMRDYLLDASGRSPQYFAASDIPDSPANVRRKQKLSAFEQPPESDSDNPVVALSVNGVDSDDSPLIFFVPSSTTGGEVSRLISRSLKKISEKAGEGECPLSALDLAGKRFNISPNEIISENSYIIECEKNDELPVLQLNPEFKERAPSSPTAVRKQQSPARVLMPSDASKTRRAFTRSPAPNQKREGYGGIGLGSFRSAPLAGSPHGSPTYRVRDNPGSPGSGHPPPRSAAPPPPSRR